jgi:NADPH-dependent glutamate synthase beta subunit-like oxidoreductase
MHEWEFQEVEEEGIHILAGGSTKQIYKDEQGKGHLELLDVSKVEFSPESRMISSEVAAGTEHSLLADAVIQTNGLDHSTEPFAAELALSPNKTIQINAETPQTSAPMVFADGNAVLGPSVMVQVMGQERRVAFYMDRMLRGESLEVPFGDQADVVDKKDALDTTKNWNRVAPVYLPKQPSHKRIQSFKTYELTLSEEQARPEANRCLNCAECSVPGMCQCLSCGSY